MLISYYNYVYIFQVASWIRDVQVKDVTNTSAIIQYTTADCVVDELENLTIELIITGDSPDIDPSSPVLYENATMGIFKLTDLEPNDVVTYTVQVIVDVVKLVYIFACFNNTFSCTMYYYITCMCTCPIYFVTCCSLLCLVFSREYTMSVSTTPPIFMYLHVHVLTQVYLHVHVLTHVYLHVHVLTQVYLHVHVHVLTQVYLHVHVLTQVYLHVHVHVLTQVYLHVHVLTQVYLHVHVLYMYMYLYILKHVLLVFNFILYCRISNRIIVNITNSNYRTSW